MATLFWKIVFGHLVGDYLLQSKKMAMTKSEKSFNGWFWCLFHSLVYTGSVCLFTMRFDFVFLSLVFLSHFPIDRWSLASWWLKLIKGRTFEEAYESKSQYREFEIAFTSIVYTVVDNTWHLLLLWGVVNLI